MLSQKKKNVNGARNVLKNIIAHDKKEKKELIPLFSYE